MFSPITQEPLLALLVVLSGICATPFLPAASRRLGVPHLLMLFFAPAALKYVRYLIDVELTLLFVICARGLVPRWLPVIERIGEYWGGAARRGLARLSTGRKREGEGGGEVNLMPWIGLCGAVLAALVGYLGFERQREYRGLERLLADVPRGSLLLAEFNLQYALLFVRPDLRCPYGWIVCGSEGRMEQVLPTDQDNALVYRDGDGEARAYFEKLAARTVHSLLELGFPPCAGGFMATRWCHPLAEWQAMFERWVRTPEPEALLDAASFFDFRPVHGDLSLEPLEAVVARAQVAPLFLRLLAQNSMQFHPTLGFFHRLHASHGGIDLKGGGIMPIVGMARVRALAAGVVVGIIAILATVAMVSWGNYVRRSARSDAMAALMDVRVKQERYRLTNPSYANRVHYSSVFQHAGDPLPALSPTRKYLIDVATASVTGFTATATPQGSQNSQRSWTSAEGARHSPSTRRGR